MSNKLRHQGIVAAALHGQVSTGRRVQAPGYVASGLVEVLVTTDLAALDMILLPAVVTYDLPRSTADNTYCIGRIGRAGAAGLAMSFACVDEPGSEARFRLIEKRQKQRAPRERIAGLEPKSLEQ